MNVRHAIAAIILPLAGCAGIDGAPRPAFTAQQEDAEIAPYTGPDAIARYESCADKFACRNLTIDARVRAVDLAFYRHERKVYRQEGRVSLGTDAGGMALSALAQVTGMGGLAAGSNLLSGGRQAYEKSVLATSAPFLLDEAMARRRNVLVRIRTGEQSPVANYSLFEALDDISAYEQAGSLSVASTTLGNDTGAAGRAAKAKLDALRSEATALSSPPAPN